MSVSDVASMAGLLEIVVILWKSIHRSMENNKEARVYTINKFASVLPEYLKVFKVRLLTLWVGVLRLHLCRISQNAQHAYLAGPGWSCVRGDAEPALTWQGKWPLAFLEGAGHMSSHFISPALREIWG